MIIDPAAAPAIDECTRWAFAARDGEPAAAAAFIRATQADTGDHGHPDPSASVSAAELLARLNPAQREAFVLTQVLGLSYQEAARSLEVPIGTIRSRVARARSELIAVIQQALAV